MRPHVAAILALLIFSALVWAAGFSYFIRKSKPLAFVILLISAAACWWATLYLTLTVLAGHIELTPDLQWHRIYMICLLVLIPVSLITGGIVGLIQQQRGYVAQYPTWNDPFRLKSVVAGRIRDLSRQHRVHHFPHQVTAIHL